MKHVIIGPLLFLVLAFVFPNEGKTQSDTTRKSIVKKKSIVKEIEQTGLVLKSGLYRLGRGELTFLLEYQNKSKWSFEAGPSLTYYDWGWDLMCNNFVWDKKDIHKPQAAYPISLENAKLGWGFTAGVKYFIEKDGPLSGRGIHLFLNHRLHRYDYPQVADNKRVADIQVDELALMYFNEDLWSIFKEVYIGIGVNQHRTEYQYLQASGSTYIIKWDSFTYLQPALYYNLRFGLPLMKK